MMKVMKFGGTSVGTPARMKEVAALCTSKGTPVFVVLSAMSGTTNTLVEIANHLRGHDEAGATAIINQLEEKYFALLPQLLRTEEQRHTVEAVFGSVFALLRSIKSDLFTSFEEKSILAQGEIMSTNMVAAYMREEGRNVVLLNALDFMRTNNAAEPDMDYIAAHLKPLVEAGQSAEVFITQGFICRNAYGEVDNLLRGGSDYTATLVGAAFGAEEVEIWTDIDGMHTGDPRIVEGTRPVPQISFEEAAELAYFGAKILHPTCIEPARRMGIPVRLLNTMEPEAEGTAITATSHNEGVKAVAAKPGVTVIRVKSRGKQTQAVFTRKVMEAFENYETPIDMMCASGAALVMSIADGTHLNEITAELERVGTVETMPNLCEVCIVGRIGQGDDAEQRVMKALSGVPLYMMCYGGTGRSLSVVINDADKKSTLQRLNDLTI